ncbi:UNVERIFIED_CONTAM: hypothetical protein RKD43_000537 [Streptomyces graminofaciens]
MAIFWKPSGNGPRERLPRRIWVPPRNSSMPASVTMNDGMPTYAIQKPCHAPASAPIARERTSASTQGTSCSTIITAAAAETKAASEPTDRSMWPEMMTIIMPMPSTRM